jgi:hypothetical protein
MTPKPNVITSEQAWKLIQQPFLARRALIASEMTERFMDDFDNLRREKQRPEEALSTEALIELEVGFTEGLAGKLLAACCEIWKKQGRPESSAFYKAVWDNCLLPFIYHRRRVAIRHLERWCAPERQPNINITADTARELLEKKFTRLRHVLRLKTEAWNGDFSERGRPAEQVAVTQAITASDAPDRPVSMAKARPLSPSEKKRRTAIFRAIEANYKGPAYCRQVDREKLRPIPEWVELGWPGSYEKAYNQDKKWKKRIQDEKYRYRVKYRRHRQVRDQDLIIETRPTRP